MLSVATQDEEDVGEELQPFGVGFSGQTVPYTIEWNQGASDKVFVTGTFAAWDKKYRLRRRYRHPFLCFMSRVHVSSQALHLAIQPQVVIPKAEFGPFQQTLRGQAS